MSEYVVYWWTPTIDRQFEEFDSLGDAQAALRDWQKKYPWNRYHLAHVIAVVEATAEYPRPKITVTEQLENAILQNSTVDP